MRITNNLSQNLQVDHTLLIESKVNQQTVGKLLDLLQTMPNNQLRVEAVIKNIQEGTGKFLIKGIGMLDIPVDSSVKQSDQGVLIDFTIADGELLAELVPQEEVAKNSSGKSKMPNEILNNLGIQITDYNKNAVELLKQYHIEPSAEHIKQLAEGSFLLSKIAELAQNDDFLKSLGTNKQDIEWSKTLKSVVVDWITQNEETKKTETTQATQATETTQKPIVEPLAEKAAEVKTNKVILNSNSLQQPVSIQTEGNKGLANILDNDSESNSPPILVEVEESNSTREKLTTSINAESEVVQDSSKNNIPVDLKTLLQGVNAKSLLPLIASNLMMTLENLNQSEQVFKGTKNIAYLKQVLFDRMSDVFSKLEPSQGLKAEILKWLEEDSSNFIVGKQMASLEQIIEKHSPEAATELKENFDQINRAVQVLEQLPNNMMAFHLPIKLGEFDTQIELYMNKKKSKNAQEDFKVLLALNTNTLGQVQVLITDQKQQIEIQFRLENDEIKELFINEELPLKNVIDQLALKNIKLSFACHFNQPPILEAFKELNQDYSSTIDMKV